MQRIIGISSTIRPTQVADMGMVDDDYIKAVEAAGGLPLILPVLQNLDQVEEMIKGIDGLILCGGMDVSPFYFGEDPHPKTRHLSPPRDVMEMELFFQAREHHLPILGICRGMQLINVALGGSLIQDIPDQRPHFLVHANGEDELDRHFIDILTESDLFASLGSERTVVNSIHHQAIGDLAPGLVVSATSLDGCIEAVEGENIWAYQFHPERWHREEDPFFLQIFIDFIGRCRP